jgi:Flp pilus assembly protein TadD
LTACVLTAIVLCAAAVRAQESDLSSSAGVFIEPRRAKEGAPRVRAVPQRTTPRRTRPKSGPTASNPKSSGKSTPAVTAESLNARAETAIDAGRFSDAVEPLRQAVKLKPDFADAQYNLAYAYRKSGDKKKALETHKRLQAINPGMAERLYPLVK